MEYANATKLHRKFGEHWGTHRVSLCEDSILDGCRSVFCCVPSLGRGKLEDRGVVIGFSGLQF
jgi:hypothetical protein